MSKLIKCKTCGGEIAKTAKVCPHCGAKNKYQSPAQAVGCLIVLLLVLAGFGSLSDKKDEIKNVEKALSELAEQGKDIAGFEIPSNKEKEIVDIERRLSELTDFEKDMEDVPMTSLEKERRERAKQRLASFMRLRGDDGAIGPVRNYVIFNVERMTNPNRFDHIETKWSPVDIDNTLFFVLIKYVVYEDFDDVKQAFLYCYYNGDVVTELPPKYKDSSKSLSNSSQKSDELFELQLEYFKKKFVNRDNSVTPVVSYIKERLDIPNSFKHVETEWNNYFDNDESTDTTFFVKMIYRAKYFDNTIETNTVVLNCSYKGKVELLYSDTFINTKEYDAEQERKSQRIREAFKEREGSTTQTKKTSSSTNSSTQTKKTSSSTNSSTQTKTNSKNTSTGNKSSSSNSSSTKSNKTSSSSKNKY